ncbi:MAG: hypothetical protein ABIO99_04780, partial [Candidatus Limnocylindria bacterium]
IRSVANTIIEVNDGEATVYPGDFEYYAAKRGVDIETRGAVEGARSTPRGVVTPAPKPRESAASAADRKRSEAEARNARHRRTRDLRSSLGRVEAEAVEVERELAEITERLSEPALYADGTLVKHLVERHNALRDRSERIGPELEELRRELSAAEEPRLVRSE